MVSDRTASPFTQISLASFVYDIGKQCIPRSDATESGVWSGSPLFTYRLSYKNLNKNEKYKQPFKRKWTGPIDKTGKIHSA